jgi:(E)-4-hydroxy-3-methylbut-2-enyl-diphosphate synthase
MTNTDTSDVDSTALICIELAQAGSELVRHHCQSARGRGRGARHQQRMLDAGIAAPLIGEFHYNGQILLTKHPACASALDKYRINPGNVGTGKRAMSSSPPFCQVAADHGKPVRIGVNGAP